ncbi:hypothetical protein Patl1_24278 [Pistacia atlantica]|uniref:Uncharacterized protein n=1 Tax=Pistacia atlantica TaxID=434234 RepID=A0ACC0ZW25_9ROSI|nr:hypothetical protein Patl1_24278 [Pistacia atlantica]
MMSNTLQAGYKLKIGIVFLWALGDSRLTLGEKTKLVLGVDTCADTVVGDEMRRGISGGQKRRLTTGEMILVHITDATVLISLLQPAPETFELFDDIILMAEGKVVYQGPCDHVVEFLHSGFRCPQRKCVADFLQEKFKESPLCKKLDEDLSVLYDKSKSHKDALSFNVYSLFKWQLIRACMSREYLLLKRNSFIYVFKTTQMDIDVLHATFYMATLFFGLLILLIDGIPELSLTTARLPVLFKQKELCFYPAWAYAIPATILKIPLSVLPSAHSTFPCAPYLYIHVSVLASVFQTLGAVMTVDGLSVNEFLAPWWQKVSSHKNTFGSSNQGNFEQSSLGALFAFTLLFNIGFILALSFLKPPRSSRAMISQEKLAKIQGSQDSNDGKLVEEKSNNSPRKGEFNFLLSAGWSYLLTPISSISGCEEKNKLQLLSDVTGALRPGVLTTLIGVSGAGKSTLLDVLPGRMAACYIEGEIKIGGYPKVQETFARVLGYCEQTDVQSPQITVEESLIFSAWLHLSPEINTKTKTEFVNQVLEIIELDEIRDALVGVPGVIGPSTKQRKRLTVAVELVANPSIIFMDEPTSGLDAQAASIVMRAVKNVVETGRTIVCTDHQPNIDIFEAFDELSSPYSEVELGVDFAQIDTDFALYEHRKALVRELSTPPPGSKDLHFPTRFAQSGLGAIYILCMETELVLLEKSFINLFRLVHAVIVSLLFGVLFWDHGKEIDTQQSLFNMFGAFYVSMIFMASITAQPLYPVLQLSAMLCTKKKNCRSVLSLSLFICTGDRCASFFMSSSNYVRDHHLTDDWILWVGI